MAITTLTRLLTDKDVQSVLGIGIQDGDIVHKVQDSEVLKGYTQIISDLLRNDFNVKSVYDKELNEQEARRSLIIHCLSRAITLTRSCPTILTQEHVGGTYHKDHFIN